MTQKQKELLLLVAQIQLDSIRRSVHSNTHTDTTHIVDLRIAIEEVESE